MEPETLEEISATARSGFYSKEEVIKIFAEERYEPGELDPTELEAAVKQAFASILAEQKRWPATTDCDRLDAAFTAISTRRVMALHNAGYTQSDGYADFQDAYENAPDRTSIIGYCFYHAQDVERAVAGGGLNFAFGPVDPVEETTNGPAVGEIIREELKRAGLHVVWDGTFATRLRVEPFNWQRRIKSGSWFPW